MTKPRTNCSKKPRRGFTLVIFAMLLFALFALAALVIDLGFVRVAQRQMQTASDTAALEGLRARDALTDLERRQEAKTFGELIFDDDLNASHGDPLQFGAGPTVRFTGGYEWDANHQVSETLELPATPVYKPNLALNVTNHPAGDLVAGQFSTGPAVTHAESNDYSRDDFFPAGSAGSADAFLVRQRRTAEALDPDQGSNGGRIPLLFGRGSLIGLDRKRDGVAVRATSIAQAQRAKSVGRSLAAYELSGATPFVLFRAAWEANAVLQIRVTAGSGSHLQQALATVGYVTDVAGAGQNHSLGETAVAATVVTPATFVSGFFAAVPASRSVYVVIVPNPGSPIDNRIIGFGLATLSAVAADQFALTKQTNNVAPHNASAIPVSAIPASAVSSIFSEHNHFSDSLLAPALVR